MNFFIYCFGDQSPGIIIIPREKREGINGGIAGISSVTFPYSKFSMNL